MDETVGSIGDTQEVEPLSDKSANVAEKEHDNKENDTNKSSNDCVTTAEPTVQDISDKEAIKTEAPVLVHVENTKSDSDTELLGSIQNLDEETGEVPSESNVQTEVESAVLPPTQTDQSAATDIQDLVESIKEPTEPNRTSEKSGSRENLLDIDGFRASPSSSPAKHYAESSPVKSSSIPIPGRRRNLLPDALSDSDSTVSSSLNDFLRRSG